MYKIGCYQLMFTGSQMSESVERGGEGKQRGREGCWRKRGFREVAT